MTTITRGKLSLILAAMFVVGAAVGSLATVYGFREQKRQDERPRTGPPPGDRNGGRKSIEERFTERLKLTDSQLEQLKPVFSQLSVENGVIRSNSFCQMELAIDRANAAIRPLLDETQRAEFEKMDQERKDFMRPWRDRGGRDRKDRDPGRKEGGDREAKAAE